MELVNFECKTCGASLSAPVAKSTDGLVRCPFCGNVWTIPKQDIRPDALQFLRMGEHDLDTGKFDDAYAAYKKVAELDPKEPEAYFGMALAEFKIQYLKDHVNNRVQPICYEVTNKKFTDSNTYLRALINATPAQKTEYERKGAEIDYILGEFYKLKQSGLDYDCFICAKVTDDATKQLTEDSKDADYIYRLLQDKGFKPFFSERELRNVTGADYEARILYALSTSECMLVVCRDESYLQTPWVKNEYMRFLKLMNDEEKESDSITIVFHGTPIEKLPGKNGKLQGINFALREADGKIVDFVDSHTPEAKARREEKIRRKAEAEQETDKRIKELEEQIKRMANAQTASMPTKTTPQAPPQTHSSDIGKFEIKNNEIVRYKGTDSVVVIPYGVTSIARGAFSGCDSLTSITIPDSVTFIGEAAFFDCINLTKVTIPNSVTSIGESTFSRCERLTSITIPDGIASIGKRAFWGCKNLTSIIIPNSVTFIEDNAFGACESLTSIIIPDGITSIAKFTFSRCKNLKSVTIPTSVKSIGEAAFLSCENLTSIAILPNSVTSIGERAFERCEGLRNIILPKNVTSIGNTTFIKCTKLETLIVEEGNPNYYSQNNCIIEKSTKKLVLGCKNSIIPKDVKAIDPRAFTGSKNFEPCPIEEGNPVFYIQNGCIINRNTNELVVGYDSSIIPGNISSIGESAFIHCENLTSIIIPNSVKSMGKEAFGWCESLTSITIPNGISSIGEYSFFACKSLTSITIPNSVISIGESAFRGCESLKNIVLPNSVTSIGERAFWGCKSLTSINIPDGIASSIGENTFSGCASLTSITIPHGVTSIGKNAFWSCKSLTSITIPNSVKSIGESAFWGCISMKSVIFESTKGWFYSCNNSSVRISENELSDPSSAAQRLTYYGSELFK